MKALVGRPAQEMIDGISQSAKCSGHALVKYTEVHPPAISDGLFFIKVNGNVG